MAKPDNSGWVIMTALLLVPTIYLFSYLAKETARFIPINQYLLMAIGIIHLIQLIYFNHRSYSKLRKERMGEVRYQLYLPPLYRAIIISIAIGLVCGVFVFSNEDSFNLGLGLFITFLIFWMPGIFLLNRIVFYGKNYVIINKEEFVHCKKKNELRILWKEVEWVDVVTKRMDSRRKNDKVGIVFKLLNGREIEVNTWRWGFSQEDVTNLMSDISAKMS